MLNKEQGVEECDPPALAVRLAFAEAAAKAGGQAQRKFNCSTKAKYKSPHPLKGCFLNNHNFNPPSGDGGSN